jgi:isocitrate/isopropylmalate dehydrogenase
MAQYRIAWLPGDGTGVEMLEAADVASKTAGEFPHHFRSCQSSSHSNNSMNTTPDLKIGLERIRSAASDVDGFQQFIQEGKHLC